jgi:hypothetical protein
MRSVPFVALSAALVLGLSGLTASAQDTWATVKGQVVYPAAKPVPERKKLDITQDKAHCLSKGDILDETLNVNPKNKGIKNVVIWLRPDNTDPKGSAIPRDKIHPDDAKRKPAEVIIDQPCCMFVKRVTVARVGDTIVVKNPAPVAHNFFWTSGNNGEFNVTIPKESDWKMPQALGAETAPIQYKCTIHPWMSGYVRIYDHPYFAVTDENGSFELKNAPAGKWRLMVWQEKVGFLGGAAGRFGTPIEIKGPATELKPIEFDIAP